MATLRIEPLHPEFGARITGVDLREPLPAETVGEIRAAIDDYSFLCFPDQPFDDERQLAFTRLLGEPERQVGVGEERRADRARCR